jgi:hypothetical protein
MGDIMDGTVGRKVKLRAVILRSDRINELPKH